MNNCIEELVIEKKSALSENLWVFSSRGGKPKQEIAFSWRDSRTGIDVGEELRIKNLCEQTIKNVCRLYKIPPAIFNDIYIGLFDWDPEKEVDGLHCRGSIFLSPRPNALDDEIESVFVHELFHFFDWATGLEADGELGSPFTSHGSCYLTGGDIVQKCYDEIGSLEFEKRDLLDRIFEFEDALEKLKMRLNDPTLSKWLYDGNTIEMFAYMAEAIYEKRRNDEKPIPKTRAFPFCDSALFQHLFIRVVQSMIQVWKQIPKEEIS